MIVPSEIIQSYLKEDRITGIKRARELLILPITNRISRPKRKVIISFLNVCTHLEEDLFYDRDNWANVIRKLHPFEARHSHLLDRDRGDIIRKVMSNNITGLGKL